MLIPGLFFVGLVMLTTLALAAASFAPWVPVWTKDLPRIFKLANLQSGDTFYDLGCGNGKTVIYAAKHYKVQAHGVELGLPLYLYCQLRKLFTGQRKNLHFHYGNLFHTDLRKVNVVYVFGMPEKLQRKLKKKLERELQPGARVVSYTFPIKGLTPVEVNKPKPADIAIYLYRF